jgi:hypothetical protein
MPPLQLSLSDISLLHQSVYCTAYEFRGDLAVSTREHSRQADKERDSENLKSTSQNCRRHGSGDGRLELGGAVRRFSERGRGRFIE